MVLGGISAAWFRPRTLGPQGPYSKLTGETVAKVCPENKRKAIKRQEASSYHMVMFQNGNG